MDNEEDRKTDGEMTKMEGGMPKGTEEERRWKEKLKDQDERWKRVGWRKKRCKEG